MTAVKQLHQPVSRDVAKTLIALKKPVYYKTKPTDKLRKATFEEVYNQSLQYYRPHA
mgnify:CR=1 FL=1